MSYFAVTIEEIASLRPHSNADRLQVASIKGNGYQFIVGKDLWKVGDRCLYIPLDALVPQPILQALKLEGRLAGAQKNRVKTIKLRGEISQGLVASLDLIKDIPESERTPEKITAFLGITKYEPEIDLPRPMDANLVDLPEGVGIYDVENCERFPSALEELMDLPVAISEKLEGSHFAVAYIEGKEWVCQRRFALELIPSKPEHYFWTVAKELRLLEIAKGIAEQKNSRHVVIRGEIIGPNIQKNIYHLQQRTVKVFDACVDRRYLGTEELREVFSRFGASELLVPLISIGKTLREWLAGRSIKDASNGQSALYATPREGIIIRPLEERLHDELAGRFILKQISPEYLALD